MTRASECFPTTSWTLVAAAGEGASRESEEALAELCGAYWGPLYAYVRRSGRSVEESRDLTQEFFARLIEKRYLRAADRDRGRFRSYLLAALKHFLCNEWDRACAAKRGGGTIPIPLDVETAEHLYRLEPADVLTPDRIFDRRWAVTLLGRAMTRLRQEFTCAGKAEIFEVIQPFLTGDSPGAYAQIALSLDMREGTLKVTVHRARRRFAALTREEVAATLGSTEEVEDEIRYLLAAMEA
jgi:DNA-directed RNA polymerase specialized sigma24 family protein